MRRAVTQCNTAYNLLRTFFFLYFKFGQDMLNTRGFMRKQGRNERTNERTNTMTKHITTLLLRSRVKMIFIISKMFSKFLQQHLPLLLKFIQRKSRRLLPDFPQIFTKLLSENFCKNGFSNIRPISAF